MSAPAAPQEQTLRANGLDFVCLERGSGPLVLCLHGFADGAYSFEPLLDALARAGYRGAAPYLRGYAPTALAADDDYSLRTLALDVIALIDALGAPDATVVGHDWGAIIAQASAALRPDRVTRLVSAGVPHLRRLFLRPTLRQLRRSHYIFKFQIEGVADRRLARNDFAALEALAAQASPRWSFSDEDWVRIKAAFEEPERLHAALHYYRSLRNNGGWTLAMSPVPAPTRMIYGAHDGVVGSEMFARQEHLFPGGLELVRMEAGHFMHREQPEEFIRHVLGFLPPRAA